MPTEIKKKIELEVVHVLFLDIVGYSRRLTNEQQTLIDQLNQVVRSSEEFQSAEAADRLIKIPTGDGMALVFYKSPAQPVECALEISRALKTYPELRVRMGVHSGPVSAVTDLNDRTNAAGVGINVAQRVMDCGDAGHILLVDSASPKILHNTANWQSQLHDLGEVEVKHGVRVHIFNLYNKELGNPEVPEKLRQAKGQTVPAVVARGEELWIAVLPFKSSGDAEMESFANGLGEDITTGLSRFRYLSVVASTSAARLKGETGDERALGAKLGARYVLEGSIRKGGSGIRVSAQLVDTQTGAQLWAETYNRDLQASSIFAAQDDIAARIVATVADSYGVLVHSMRAAIRQKDDADLTPVEWQFQYFAYREQITPSAHAALKSRWSARRGGTIGNRTCGPVSRRSMSTNTRLASGTTRPLSIGPWLRPGARSSWIGQTSSRWSRWRRHTFFARTSRRSVPRPNARWRSIRSTLTRSGSWDWRLCTPASSSEAPQLCAERWN